MSSTNRGAERSPNDYYRTPGWCIRAILRHLPEPTSVLDPGCGDGAILDEVRDRWPTAERFGVEIDPGRAEAARARGHAVAPCDYLTCALVCRDLIISNPPFSLAMEFIQQSLALGRGPVVMLLRLSMLASMKRAPFWRANPCGVYVLPRRPSFTGQGTDSADYAWFVWGTAAAGTWQILDVESK